jgi:D-beta-D-heptose 7-phosphate kinase/D-beta-D-heptose 1-phosphate adenosyltransferase
VAGRKGSSTAPGKILSQAAVAREVQRLRNGGRKTVFTNGCFDLLHVGHVRYLQEARRLGDALVVAVNSDASVRRIKDPSRPLTTQRDRLEVLAALECVTFLCLFGEQTPLRAIRKIKPDILVKGGDWPVEKIVGRQFVEGRGGKVLSIPLVKGISTTEMIRRIRSGSKR